MLEKETTYSSRSRTIGLAILQYAKYKGGICMISDIVESKLEEAKNLGQII